MVMRSMLKKYFLYLVSVTLEISNDGNSFVCSFA